MMQVVDLARVPVDELLGALRTVRLQGQETRPYRHADLRIERLSPGSLSPAQNYVLQENVDRVDELRRALAPHGVDPFALTGAVWLTIEGLEEQVPLLPPVVEVSTEADGRVHRLISDGLHRVFAAREAGEDISVVLVDGVDEQCPYYAYPLEDGWAGVELLAELPEVRQKKAYRWPDNYKALFREYNALFPGVQTQRKRSNPASFQA